MAYARSIGLTMSVAVVDAGGALISQDRMDGGSLLGVRGAPGKAMAAVIPAAHGGDRRVDPDRARPLLRADALVPRRGLPDAGRCAAARGTAW